MRGHKDDKGNKTKRGRDVQFPNPQRTISVKPVGAMEGIRSVFNCRTGGMRYYRASNGEEIVFPILGDEYGLDINA